MPLQYMLLSLCVLSDSSFFTLNPRKAWSTLCSKEVILQLSPVDLSLDSTSVPGTEGFYGLQFYSVRVYFKYQCSCQIIKCLLPAPVLITYTKSPFGSLHHLCFKTLSLRSK